MEKIVERGLRLQADKQRVVNELIPKRKPYKESNWFDIECKVIKE